MRSRRHIQQLYHQPATAIIDQQKVAERGCLPDMVEFAKAHLIGRRLKIMKERIE
jgi:hypothetical protein